LTISSVILDHTQSNGVQLHKHHELHVKLSVVNRNHGEINQEDLPNLNLDEGIIEVQNATCHNE
jgi:hypothetical protein